jgi:hypothetical protein
MTHPETSNILCAATLLANRPAGLRQLGAALLAQRIGEAAAQRRGRIAA